MKTPFILICILFSTLGHTQAFEHDFTVVTRTERGRADTDTVTLTELISNDSFDGKYFKIVKGKSDEAIRFDAGDALTFKAANAYYHLTRARQYFVTKLKSDYVAKIPKMIIRIEHTNQFSELGHFAHDNMDPQFNNALTVPAGKGLASRGVKPWEIEIWFRPTKRIHLRDLKVNGHENLEYSAFIKQFRNQIHMQSLQRLLASTIVAVIDGRNPFTLENAIRSSSSSLIMEAAYHLFDPITRALTRKWYILDTAMVPEIIYHEYSHAALSDHLVLSHSTAIIEGMADFFAGQIANSPKLAKHIKEYNTYVGKNANKKQSYRLQLEMPEYANTDFVFGLLWEMKKIVGDDTGEAFMYELRKTLTTNSSIRGELIEGLLATCKTNCKQPFNDRIRILKALNARGI